MHESFHNFAQVGNGFFEITFSIKIGSKHAFENSFNYDGINLILLAWHLGFSSNKQQRINCFTTLHVVGSIHKIEPILEEWTMFLHHGKETWQGSLNGIV